MGVLTRIDGTALARYCVLWAMWKKCMDFIKKNGDTFVIRDKVISKKWPHGRPIAVKQYPQAKQALKLHAALHQMEGVFGLNPSARTGLQAIKPEENASGNDRFFNRSG